MRNLYSYLIEKQGYLDYDAFIDDIMYAIYTSEETVGRICKDFIDSIDPKLKEYSGYISDMPKCTPEFIHFNIKIKSDNYPYWLKELYIKSYNDITYAAVDTDLIVIDNDKKTLKSATIYINTYSFFADDSDDNLFFAENVSNYINKIISDKIWKLKIKYNFKKTDEYYNEQEKLITELKKTLKLNKSDYLNIYKNFLKDDSIKNMISHELKHLFDYCISHYKENVGLMNAFEPGVELDGRKNIHYWDFIDELSRILYVCNKAEISAYQQQIISEIKHRKHDAEFIEQFDQVLHVLKHQKVDTFSQGNYKFYGFRNILYDALRIISKRYINFKGYGTDGFIGIIKAYKISEELFGKKFNGSTGNDYLKFLEQCFDKVKNIYITILKKAAKHL